MRVSLTRTVGFRATHRFWRPEWSEAENRERFGPTADAPGHSHEYRCAVTVSRELEPADDMVVDLGVLDRLLAEEVVAPHDEKHLNLAVPEFAYGKALPTCEAFARYLFGRLAARLPDGVTLDRVRVAEDATLHADCERERGAGGRGQG
jgi:6-pyruvoyltetrahydropterin/6-carboxytetrahydropterin synthase